MNKIVNTIIFYDNYDEVTTYLNVLSKMDGITYLDVVIVFNKVKDDDENRLKNYASDLKISVYFFNPSKNLGYLNGMLFGYQQYKLVVGDNYQTDYIIMSNTDINYPSKNFFSLLKSNQYDDNTWCIGPSIFVPLRRSYDNPVLVDRRPLKQINRLLRIFKNPKIGSLYIKIAGFKELIYKKDKHFSRFVYEVHGCYFILKPNAIDAFKKRPFLPFMYSEESYIAEICYKNQKKIFYDTNLEVIHNEHAVTDTLKRTKIASYIYESMKYIKNEFYKDEINND